MTKIFAKTSQAPNERRKAHVDFYKIVTKQTRKSIDVYADFIVDDLTDILFRGHAFQAVWDEGTGLWSKKDTTVRRMVDKDIAEKVKALSGMVDGVEISPHYISSYRSQGWKEFLAYAKSMSDNLKNVELDSKIFFSNQETKKSDYATHKLPYPLVEGECPAWNELVGTLYSKEERQKIEWAIGSIITGDSRKIQKFIVFYGEPGSGKGTIMEIIEKLFYGYCTTFDAKALAANGNAFATEVFRNNPLVAIQRDGDLSRIEDNTKLNSIVSHEPMTVNEKFKSSYTMRMNCFLFMGSNKPVKITDAKSGLIRRLIDVHPTNKKLPPDRYFELMDRIDFELGAIAWHCRDIYKKLGKNAYSTYKPIDMMYKTDLFFNFVEDSYGIFADQNGTTLKAAYAMYKQYCEDSGAEYKLPMYKFREELKNYFQDFDDVGRMEDGKQVRSYYRGFLSEKFTRIEDRQQQPLERVGSEPSWILLDRTTSLLDRELASCPAQYATKKDIPGKDWASVHTVLRDLDTGRVHFVLVPENHIVIDFDILGDDGQKSKEKNLKAAAAWPPTYAEFSKGGSGVHLHYIYDGDPSELASVYEPGIEVKVFSGNSSLRRRLSFCNDIPIAHISSGLPKKEAKVLNRDIVVTEKGIRTTIQDCLQKKHHGATKPEVDFIKKVLNDAYASDISYDVTDMRPAVVAFANNSTHQAQACLKNVLQMKWKSEDHLHAEDKNENDIVFFDTEVFPNLFLLNWKKAGEGTSMVRMINPGPLELEDIFRYRLIGFNCRRYDNHILYARYLGYSVEELYKLSQRIIAGSRNAMFSEAYNISYTDIYDFSSKKQSLKKWEIELGIHHQELGLPWDQPVPEEKWPTVAEYCDNDVRATEAVYNHLQADWTARKILAALSGLSVNDTTNQHTTKIIFGDDKKPQRLFNYRNLGGSGECETYRLPVEGDTYCAFDAIGKPVFPGYSFNLGKSVYRGEEVGEGGYVYAEPGVYFNVALLDIASMHPSSIVAENLFGDEYTARFRDILQARILIKHKDFDGARKILDGKLAPFLNDEGEAKDLASALKIAINSVYGLTSAKFDNPFRDPRNIDNIVAKRGALFMVNLKHAVQDRGFTVAHIKTDSIKIPNATPDIIQFVMDYGKLYGYNFEHEATYERMCLVNDAVYIARYLEDGKPGKWTATGAQFQQPYVFKTLFSHEPVTFDDLCEAKSVTTSLYLDMNEFLPEGEHNYRFIGKAGQFTPVKPGCGGGELVREKDGKYYSATGAKGYRWLESELLRGTEKEQDVDLSFYERMAQEAIRDISEYFDFYDFVGADTTTVMLGDAT